MDRRNQNKCEIPKRSFFLVRKLKDERKILSTKASETFEVFFGGADMKRFLIAQKKPVHKDQRALENQQVDVCRCCPEMR